MTDLWYGTSGPPDADIVVVGEAWGKEEADERKPFVGGAGGVLNVMLAEAKLDRNDILCTNVVAARPDHNDMWQLFHPADLKLPTLRHLHPTDFVKASMRRLVDQIRTHPRKLVIVTGNWPLWALTACTGWEKNSRSGGRRTPTGIMNWRGSMWYMLDDPLVDCDARSAKHSIIPLLPIVHPAAIMREWENRAVTVHDLKSRVPMAMNENWRHNPSPTFWAPPTFEQACTRLRHWIARCEQGPLRLACDIETTKTLISVIGFADSVHFAMAIPFVRKVPTGLESYWTIEQEVVLIKLIHKLLTHKNCLVEGQNFLYDTQYFQYWLALLRINIDHDTMMAQNLLFPGTPKGLDVLSSLYCRYHWYWKDDGKEWDTKGSLEELLVYNCWDLVKTYEVADTQRQLIVQLGFEEQWKLKKYTYDLCLRMMNRGVKIDKERRLRLTMELSMALSDLGAELLSIIPQEWVKPGHHIPWYRSDSQTRTVFYDLLGMKPVLHRKTKQPTVGKEAINEIKKKNPEWTGLVERLRLYSSADNTATVLRAGLDPDDRLRCFFKPDGTETHRLSSTKNAFGRGTNLQNLTKGKEDD